MTDSDLKELQREAMSGNADAIESLKYHQNEDKYGKAAALGIQALRKELHLNNRTEITKPLIDMFVEKLVPLMLKFTSIQPPTEKKRHWVMCIKSPEEIDNTAIGESLIKVTTRSCPMTMEELFMIHMPSSGVNEENIERITDEIVEAIVQNTIQWIFNHTQDDEKDEIERDTTQFMIRFNQACGAIAMDSRRGAGTFMIVSEKNREFAEETISNIHGRHIDLVVWPNTETDFCLVGYKGTQNIDSGSFFVIDEISSEKSNVSINYNHEVDGKYFRKFKIPSA